MRFLLDTNVIIHLLKRSSPLLETRVSEEQRDNLGIPSLVMHELFFGAYRSQQVDRNLSAFLTLKRDFAIVDFDAADALEAGAIRANLAARGTPIGPYDVLIAGQAKARDLCLITNNTREFGRVAGLRIEDWTNPIE